MWINGTFGVGKTSTAAELVSLVPHAQVFDPEQLGWFLRRTVGLLRPGDFQHLHSWCRGTIRLIDRTARKVDTVVVPMSVLRPRHLDELLTGLRSRGHMVRHVLLDAPADVVRARITTDEINTSAVSWRTDHLMTYEAAKPELATRGFTIDTSTRSARDVAAELASQVLSLHNGNQRRRGAGSRC